jgi:hypothetical protein
MRRLTSALFLLVTVALSLVWYGCGGSRQQDGDLRFPKEVRKALPSVREPYEFAARHPEVLGQMPCYCGCASIGHASNPDCFIRQIDLDGTVHIDPMGFT